MKQDWTDKLKDKMDGYVESPSGRVWDGICSRLSTDGRARVIPPWLWKGAAAAVMAGIFLVFKFNGDDPVHKTASISSPAGQAEVQRIHMTEERETGIDTRFGESVPSTEVPRHIIPCEVTLAAQESIDTTVEDDPTEHQEGQTVIKSKAARKKSEDNGSDGDEAKAWAEFLANEDNGRHRRPGEFSAGISANGSGSGHYSESRQMSGILGANPLESGLASADWADKDFKGIDNFIVYNRPETETRYYHKMPVRISATARYEFSGIFGIESGISWSVLSSELKTGDENAGGWTRGEQTLHYIGVPLNLSMKLFESRFFTAYVIAGGMMEAPVRGSLKTDEYADGRFIGTTDSSLRPKELQWSVNAAAGAQLNILPELGLFIEPGVSHRFRNGTKIRSAYTDRPTDFALGFGLRYSFSKR